MERGVTGRRSPRRSKSKNYREVDTIYIHGGDQEMTIVSEAGLYSLIL